MKTYLVGGCVRDTLMGRKPSDFDYAVEAESYDEMRSQVLAKGYTIYYERPQHNFIKAKLNDEVHDFVICTCGCKNSNILTDLSRRDFSINSMAMSEDGVLIDPFNGQDDLLSKTIDYARGFD